MSVREILLYLRIILLNISRGRRLRRSLPTAVGEAAGQQEGSGYGYEVPLDRMAAAEIWPPSGHPSSARIIVRPKEH